MIGLLALLAIAALVWAFFQWGQDGGTRSTGRRTIGGQPAGAPWNRLEFMGENCTSPSGRYTLVCQDSDIWSGGGRGGFREKGRGRVTLFDGQRVQWQQTFERPNSGAVADDGTLCFADWLFGEGLKSVFYLFGPDGQERVRTCVKANAMGCGLDQQTRLAWFETCNADSADGSLLLLYDMDSAALLLRCERPTEGIQAVRRHEGLYSVFGHVETPYQLDEAGGVTNLFDVALDEARHDIKRGSPVWAVQRLLHVRSAEELDQDTRSWLAGALERELPRIEKPQRAIALRQLGEFRLVEGDAAGALEYFDRALRYDPKIGVKRRAEKLRKELNA